MPKSPDFRTFEVLQEGARKHYSSKIQTDTKTTEKKYKSPKSPFHNFSMKSRDTERAGGGKLVRDAIVSCSPERNETNFKIPPPMIGPHMSGGG